MEKKNNHAFQVYLNKAPNETVYFVYLGTWLNPRGVIVNELLTECI